MENGSPLYFATNPIFITYVIKIGSWSPRYLVSDFVSAIAKAPGDYEAKVVQVNLARMTFPLRLNPIVKPLR